MQDETPGADLQRHFRQVFFENPWTHSDVDSLVWEDDSGSVTGFLGLVPRPIKYEGDELRGVVQTQLMVDPDRAGPLVTVRLIRELMSRDYDLAIADGATPEVAEIWERCGGTRLWLPSFEWERILRPARRLVSWLDGRRPKLRGLLRLAEPIRSATDAVFARIAPNRFHDPSDRFRREPITAEALDAAHGELFDRERLYVAYDRDSWEWLLQRLREKERFGDLFGSLLYDDSGAVAGWYLYLTKGKGSSAWVVQVSARRGEGEEVLSHLFQDAWSKGAFAVRGTMDTRLAVQVKELHGTFTVGAPWTLCYTPHRELLATLQSGEARLSRLDMEFWMRFTGG